MTNRREFLQIGIAAGALPLAARGAFAPAPAAEPSTRPSAVPLYKVVYDPRFEDAAAFGARARELGLATHAFKGDITAFWFHELDAVWRARQAGPGRRPAEPMAVAGLTAHGPLFCLERLGWERGLRVVYRAEHKAAGAHGLEHWVSGPNAMVTAARSLERAGDRWARATAEIAVACPQGRAEITAAHIAAAASPAAAAALERAESLYSWVIAPAVRAGTAMEASA